MTLTYYAYAINGSNEIEQLFVIRKNGKKISQEWTGTIYETINQANLDMIRLNCQ